jgi:Flp pilus assembly pilin Flp
MNRNLKRFVRDEDGAVTVDWVVMTAAIVGLGIAVVVAVSPGMTGLAGTISQTVGSFQVGGGGGEAEAEVFSGIGANPDKGGFEYWSEGPINSWSDRVAADAPAGYNFDTPLLTNSNALVQGDYPVFASNDGASYSINGQVYSADQFNAQDFWTP